MLFKACYWLCSTSFYSRYFSLIYMYYCVIVTFCQHVLNEHAMLCYENIENDVPAWDVFDVGRCECLPGFSGELCQQDVNECESSPCLNGATCLDLPANYSCVCPPAYAGLQCQLRMCQTPSKRRKDGRTDAGNRIWCILGLNCNIRWQ